MNGALNRIDIENLLTALRAEIDVSFRAKIAERRMRRPSQYSKSAFSEFSAQRSAKRLANLTRRVDRVEHYHKERLMGNSATAADIAMTTTMAKRAAGEKVSYREEHKRILTELQTSPAAVKKYSKELESAQNATKYLKAPPAKGAPPVFTTFSERASILAMRRAGNDHLAYGREYRRALNQLFDAAANKMSGRGAAQLYADDPEEGELVERAYASLSDRASDMALQRCRDRKPGAFSEHYRDALSELRKEAESSLRERIGVDA